ncbi:MAG TPA: SRPBCC domain-containing protein [Gemmataceae bacterium]|nr:SRPBCC domain-containing protein [Gemmataceae bacterium]
MKSRIKITGNCLQITRTLDAPQERVFAAWAEPAKLQRWTGCKDATDVVCESDFREGGSFTTKMHIGGHANCDCVFSGVYQEIRKPSKIVYNVNLGPASTRVTVELFAEGAQTRMVLTQEDLPSEIIRFVEQGTLESFDKLDAALAAQGTTA